jgi:hypothetical protein
MLHTITSEDVREVTKRLLIAIEVADQTLKSNDPLVVFEVYDRLHAHIHCCRDSDQSPWASSDD